MSDLTIRWPDEDAERVLAARGRLEAARARLTARDPGEVLEALAAVFDLWSDGDSLFRRRLLDEHPAAAGFTREVVAAGLDVGLQEWTGAALRAALGAERDALLAGGARTIAPFASTSVMLAGSIPMPSLLSCVLPLALQSPVLVKPASRDPVTPRLLVESIASVDAELARAIEVVAFSRDDAASLDGLLAAECVVASGSNETIRSIAARVAPAHRLVAYGHKMSIAVVADDDATESAAAIAEGLSLDVALWDQLGCLSPVAVYVVGARCAKASDALARALADALDRRSSELPRAPVPPSVSAAIKGERDGAGVRAASGEAVAVHASDDTSWTVVREADAGWRTAPLHRFVRVHPLEEPVRLAEALGPMAPYLSSAAISARLRDEESRHARAALTALGASRLCAPGRMQAPPIDWPHDGQPLLAPIARLQG